MSTAYYEGDTGLIVRVERNMIMLFRQISLKVPVWGHGSDKYSDC